MTVTNYKPAGVVWIRYTLEDICPSSFCKVVSTLNHWNKKVSIWTKNDIIVIKSNRKSNSLPICVTLLVYALVLLISLIIRHYITLYSKIFFIRFWIVVPNQGCGYWLKACWKWNVPEWLQVCIVCMCTSLWQIWVTWFQCHIEHKVIYIVVYLLFLKETNGILETSEKYTKSSKK